MHPYANRPFFRKGHVATMATEYGSGVQAVIQKTAGQLRKQLQTNFQCQTKNKPEITTITPETVSEFKFIKDEQPAGS